MKSYISADKNLYYEAPDKLNQNDVEVPPRPSPDHTFINGSWVDKNFLQQAMPFHAMQVPQVPVSPAQSNLSDLVNVIKQLQTLNTAQTQAVQPQPDANKKDVGMGSFIGDKFTWKDLITILYFAGGIIGLWMHMNERIIVLEQKVVTIEKGSAELQNSFKEFTVENKNQLKSIDSKISDLQQMVISRISSSPSQGKR